MALLFVSFNNKVIIIIILLRNRKLTKINKTSSWRIVYDYQWENVNKAGRGVRSNLVPRNLDFFSLTF